MSQRFDDRTGGARQGRRAICARQAGSFRRRASRSRSRGMNLRLLRCVLRLWRPLETLGVAALNRPRCKPGPERPRQIREQHAQTIRGRKSQPDRRCSDRRSFARKRVAALRVQRDHRRVIDRMVMALKQGMRMNRARFLRCVRHAPKILPTVHGRSHDRRFSMEVAGAQHLSPCGRQPFKRQRQQQAPQQQSLGPAIELRTCVAMHAGGGLIRTV